MPITFRPLTSEDARAILSWRYPPPYDLYDFDPATADEDLRYLLDPTNRFHAILDPDEGLVGFCSFGQDARVRVTIAAFNRRARRVWEKLGFLEVSTFAHMKSGAPFAILVKALEAPVPRHRDTPRALEVSTPAPPFPYYTFLPATDPAEDRFGAPPRELPGIPTAAVHALTFPTEVWYNVEVRREAVKQLRALDDRPQVLIGFSKSGLGALNLVIDAPGLVRAVLVFDAPLAHQALPPWNTARFYDQASWAADLPLNRIDELKQRPDRIRLVLVSGANFHEDHEAFSAALTQAGIAHRHIRDPKRPHHWNAGWIEAYIPYVRG